MSRFLRKFNIYIIIIRKNINHAAGSDIGEAYVKFSLAIQLKAIKKAKERYRRDLATICLLLVDTYIGEITVDIPAKAWYDYAAVSR